MNISLKPVTKDNWIACIDLTLHPEQENNLGSNVETIAESKFETDIILRAIYKGDRVIGMLAYCVEGEPFDPEIYWIFHFMIDKDFQNQGYGKQALNLAIAEIVQLKAKKIYTSHKLKNKIAGRLYQKLGFKYIRSLEDGDLLMEKII